MLNLKNTLLAITLASGTIALAWEPFTPKLIIKNTGPETLIFNEVSDSFWHQLRMQNSKNLVRRTKEMRNVYDPSHSNGTVNWSEIELVPGASITLDSIPKYFGNNKTTLFFSGDTYPEALTTDDEGYRNIPRELTKLRKSDWTDLKAFTVPDTVKQAQVSKKDLIVSMAGYTSDHKQYLRIVDWQLIDRA